MAPPNKPKSKGAEDRPPDVELHDEVYFRHASGPKRGRVKSRGKHGCHIEADGEMHQVKWEHMLGHAVRVQANAKVVDEGEDGMLVEDEDGRRRYIHDPVPAEPRSPAPLRKSHTPAVLFFGQHDALAKAIANAPGLALRDTTDRTGKHTKRWMRTAPDQKAVKRPAKAKPRPEARVPAHERPLTGGANQNKHPPGAKVTFKIGDLEGAGEVVGTPGEHGAHVRDSSGHEHKVLWSQMSRGDTAKPEGKGPAGMKESDQKFEGRPRPQRPDYAPREEGETDKAYAKRVIDKTDAPEHLPEEHDRFFHMEGASVIPLSKLVSAKSAEENKQGADNGPKRMAAAFHGDLGKRDPIKVTPNGDGTYTVVDGNGTMTSAKNLGWQGLPTMIVQPTETQEELYAAGAEALDHLSTWLNKGKGICDRMGFRTFDGNAGQKASDEDLAQPGGVLMIAPLKGEERASQKVAQDYGGDWSRLKDVARCSLVVDSLKDVDDVIDRLMAEGMIPGQPPKNRYKGKPTDEGYRDVNYIVRAPNGHLFELQINTKAMVEAKSKGHKAYEVTRELAGKYGDRPPTTWARNDNSAYWTAIEAQKKVYGEAYQKLTGAG